MDNESVKFRKYLEKLQSIYFHALSAFYVFESIEELKVPNIVGAEEAKENLRIMNNGSGFGGFFLIVRHTLNFYFLMELAKILDDAKQSLHLNKIINFAKSNKQKLNVEAFKETNQDRAFLQELSKRYEGITKEDLEEIDKRLERTKNIREKIKEYRDQNLAHEDLKKKKIIITQEEVVKIFSLIEKILNIFSYKTDFSTTSYQFAKSNCKEDTKRVFEYLKRFEPYRKQEIKEKYQI